MLHVKQKSSRKKLLGLKVLVFKATISYKILITAALKTDVVVPITARSRS